MKNCKEVPPGNAVCDMCNSGRPDLCRYANTQGAMKEIDNLRAAIEWVCSGKMRKSHQWDGSFDWGEAYKDLRRIAEGRVL